MKVKWSVLEECRPEVVRLTSATSDASESHTGRLDDPGTVPIGINGATMRLRSTAFLGNAATSLEGVGCTWRPRRNRCFCFTGYIPINENA